MTASPTKVIIRPLERADRDPWAALWRDYLAFYETALPEIIYDTHFERLLGDDPRDFHGLVAVLDGQLIGLTHYIFHRHGWKVEDTCYLQDLYVAEDARGTHTGRALIEAVYAAADAKNCPSVYWTTQSSNTAGRRLYDRVGQLTDFIKYQRPT